MYNYVYIHLEKVETASQNACTVTVPIGQYADFEVHSFLKSKEHYDEIRDKYLICRGYGAPTHLF